MPTATDLFWLSFADPDLPKGTQFLGGCVVRATSFIEAVQVSHALGINPGGEVQGHPVAIPDGFHPVPEAYIERLLSRDDCARMDEEMIVR